MKTTVAHLAMLIATSTLAACQEAKVHGSVDVTANHEDGLPVSGAKVGVSYYVGSKPSPGGGFPRDINEAATGLTDDKGKAKLEFESVGTPDGRAWVKKDGFYLSRYPDLEWAPDGSGRWKAELNVVLKSIKNPIPMYANNMVARANWHVRIPEIGKEYGYDFMLCEALPPLGGGKTADFFFRVEGSYISVDECDLTLKIRFPGEGEGLVEFDTPGRPNNYDPSYPGSELQSAHEAPAGGYVPILERRFSVAPGKPEASDGDFRRNFYFKSRGRRGPDGRMVYHFGKIYGDLDFRRGNAAKGVIAWLGWSCSYFNPTPGDRNVEFDVTRNLLPKTSGAGDKGGGYEERLPVTWP